MIAPPCARISRNAAWFVYKVPLTFTSKTASHSASVMSSAAADRSMPATWASTSRWPANLSATAPNASSTDDRLLTSQRRNQAVPEPAASAAAAAAAPSPALTSSAATSAPAATYARNVDAPMPCAVPVTAIRIPARAPDPAEPASLSGIGAPFLAYQRLKAYNH